MRFSVSFKCCWHCLKFKLLEKILKAVQGQVRTYFPLGHIEYLIFFNFQMIDPIFLRHGQLKSYLFRANFLLVAQIIFYLRNFLLKSSEHFWVDYKLMNASIYCWEHFWCALSSDNFSRLDKNKVVCSNNKLLQLVEWVIFLAI